MHRATLAIWLLSLALRPAPAGAGEESAAAADEPPINWVDTGHSLATTGTQELTRWMDGFFGDPEYDIEQAESWLRLDTEFEWDEELGTDLNLRLRGKVQLPKISQRLNLIFAGEESEDYDADERNLEDQLGLQFNLEDSDRHRFDLTLGVTSSGLRPGLRYRNQGDLGVTSTYRFTQRFQHERDEGFYSTSQLDINRALDGNSLMRWSSRAIWGEETLGVEWRSRIGLRHRLWEESKRPMALQYYAAINGATDPGYWVRNYRLALRVRRQVYRKFLFLEIEPGLNFRRRLYEDDREFAWSVMARLQIALEKDLRRVVPEREEAPGPETAAGEQRALPGMVSGSLN